NRIVKITDSNSTIAEYAYDALGRRIRKIADSDTRLYYYNNNNQVLIATDTFDNLKEWSIFGNYIDEVVYSMGGYCVHDHLYSVVAITSTTGIVLERYEYDAYGQPTFYNADFSTSYSTSQLSAETPYLFTGRRVDILDAGSLKLQYNRNRYYSYSLGRWLTQDPLGITPNPQFPNEFYIIDQYEDGSNIYEYTGGNPVVNLDAYGLNYAPPPAPGPEIYDVKGECPTKCCKTSYSKSKCPVKMVPVWHCTRKLGGFPIQVPALALEHCYVCLSGPNSGCLGVQAKIPSCVDACKKAYPNSWQKRRKCKKACRALKGTEIEPEMDPTGKCTKRCLTPEESTKLAGQASNMARNYELLGYNCCAWSNSVTSTKCK
ncbi:MAG: hypothetical protein KAS96_11285, partial [Planctomycetes bacterium]|nr:hypothetical protein [Planctomycetota bacterium]